MMLRAVAMSAALIAAMLTAVAVASARTDATPTLKGTVGPGFTITLKQNGKKVKSLKAGSYNITVADKSSIHSFTLEQQTGGSFEKAITTVPFMGTKTVKVKLKAGKWKYYCPPHESGMFGFFTVK